MKSSRGNSSNSAVVNTVFVDKENTLPSGNVNLHPRQKTKQKYSQEQSQEPEPSKEVVLPATTTEPQPVKDQIMLTSKLEAIEQKLMKLQSLKDETINEFSALLSEINELIPILDQLNSVEPSEGTPTVNQSNESGLARLLSRLQKLQQEYQKRRSVSEKRLDYRIDAVKERYSSELLHNKNECESEIAETAVALIHRHMAKNNGHSLGAIEPNSNANSLRTSSSSVISARKRSLPAINQPANVCPPPVKMARRQSVAAYPQNIGNREMTNATILNLNQNILVTPKSAADADLLAIKSRISKALKR